MKSIILYLFFFLGLFQFSFAQNEGSLLDDLGEENTTDYITNAFKSPRVINSHSIEMHREGVLDFRILHRFGMIDQGAYNFFGLDNATMRMSFDYGITDNSTVGIGRSTRNKELDGFIKWRFLQQSTGQKNMPVSVVGVAGIVYNTLRTPFPGISTGSTERVAYYYQILVGRKFSDKFSFQLAPFLVYRNFTSNELDPNGLYGLELGGRYKLTNRIALVVDYSMALNRFPNIVNRNPLSIGIDIETGGHVFQLHFSNAVGMNERSFISDVNGDWLKGEVQFGFNLSRVFQIKKVNHE